MGGQEQGGREPRGEKLARRRTVRGGEGEKDCIGAEREREFGWSYSTTPGELYTSTKSNANNKVSAKIIWGLLVGMLQRRSLL